MVGILTCKSQKKIGPIHHECLRRGKSNPILKPVEFSVSSRQTALTVRQCRRPPAITLICPSSTLSDRVYLRAGESLPLPENLGLVSHVWKMEKLSIPPTNHSHSQCVSNGGEIVGYWRSRPLFSGNSKWDYDSQNCTLFQTPFKDIKTLQLRAEGAAIFLWAVHRGKLTATKQTMALYIIQNEEISAE